MGLVSLLLIVVSSRLCIQLIKSLVQLVTLLSSKHFVCTVTWSGSVGFGQARLGSVVVFGFLSFKAKMSQNPTYLTLLGFNACLRYRHLCASVGSLH